MKYRRMPIEIEAPEQIGYHNIKYNLSESSVTDSVFKDLSLDLNDLILCYGDHLGKPELRKLIADYSGIASADDVLITAGAASALFMINTSLLQENDHLIVMKPNYATNIETPRQIGASIDFLNLSFDDSFAFDCDKLESMIKDNTRLISLTFPVNPTGTMIDLAQLKKLAGIAEKYNIYVLIDETYRELSFDNMLPVAASLSKNIISVSSLSKTYGLPGIRIGWLICRDKKLFETLLAAKEQIFICNSIIDEEIAYLYYKNRDCYISSVKKHVMKNFGILKNWMNEQEYLEWVEPKGGVVCFPRIKSSVNIDPDAFYQRLLNNYSTMTGPGHWFEMDKRYMRLGYGWPLAEELKNGLSNIEKAIKDSLIL